MRKPCRWKIYRYCRIARKLLTGENAVGRSLRDLYREGPFVRTSRRRLLPFLRRSAPNFDGKGDTIGVGKIGDIFAGEVS